MERQLRLVRKGSDRCFARYNIAILTQAGLREKRVLATTPQIYNLALYVLLNSVT